MRGAAAGWGESGDGTKNGITTNMHITSSLVDGPVPKELCVIPTLREHDFGGQLNRGHLTGAWPVPACAAAKQRHAVCRMSLALSHSSTREQAL